MASENELLSGQEVIGQKSRVAHRGMRALHKAAMSLADFRLASARLRTKDLVGLLLSHGARAWRASQPRANVRVRAVSPGGLLAVKIRLQ